MHVPTPLLADDGVTARAKSHRGTPGVASLYRSLPTLCCHATGRPSMYEPQVNRTWRDTDHASRTDRPLHAIDVVRTCEKQRNGHSSTLLPRSFLL